jgi:hypothetical protein
MWLFANYCNPSLDLQKNFWEWQENVFFGMKLNQWLDKDVFWMQVWNMGQVKESETYPRTKW